MAASTPRRMATRSTPDPDSSNTSQNSSYRDTSNRTLDESDDKSLHSESECVDDTDTAVRPKESSPSKSPTLVGSRGSVRKRNASPRGRLNNSHRSPKLYPSLTPEDSPSSLYPDLYEKAKANPISPISMRLRTDSGGSTRTRYHSASSNIGNSPRKSPKPAQQDNQNISNTCMICLIVGVFLFFFFCVKPWLFPPTELEAATDDRPMMDIRQDMLDSFKEEMKAFQKKFPSQSNRFWNVIKAASKGVMRVPAPVQPAVIILAGDNSSRKTMECLVQQFSEIVTKVYGASSPVIIKKDDAILKSSPKDLKLLLDEKLSVSFQKNAKAAVVYSVGDLPGEAAMIFHAYCDNENAPYKDAIILFTVDMGSKVAKSEEDSILETFLFDKYSVDLDADSLSALLSRIANNIAYVKPETEEIISEHC